MPSLQSLIKIADYLNVPLLFLLGDNDDNYFCKSEKPVTFHQRLQQLADEKNKKYSEIAHSMPFARNSFYEWIKRNNLPSLENLLILSEYFEVSPDYLLGRTDDRN